MSTPANGVPAPDKYHWTIKIKAEGNELEIASTVNGEKAWQKVNDNVEEMSGENWCGLARKRTSYGLLNCAASRKAIHIDLARRKQAARQACSRVKVSSKERPTCALLRQRYAVALEKRSDRQDEFQEWKEVKDETVYSDYRKVDGVQRFAR